MMTKTNNQSKQKIKNIMTYKVYTHRRTHTHVYIPFFHITIKLNVCFSINIYSAEIFRFFGWLWMVVGGCRWLHVVAYFSITLFKSANDNQTLKLSITAKKCLQRERSLLVQNVHNKFSFQRHSWSLLWLRMLFQAQLAYVLLILLWLEKLASFCWEYPPQWF